MFTNIGNSIKAISARKSTVSDWYGGNPHNLPAALICPRRPTKSVAINVSSRERLQKTITVFGRRIEVELNLKIIGNTLIPLVQLAPDSPLHYLARNEIQSGFFTEQLSRYPSIFAAFFPRKININASGFGGFSGSKDFFTSQKVHVVHHELLHWFETYLNNRISIFFPFNHFLDPINAVTDNTWKRIFSSCSYLNEYSKLEDRTVAPPIGFPSAYATTFPCEDRAEVAAMLFTTSRSSLIDMLRASDVLRKKVEVITGCSYNAEIGLFESIYTKNELKKLYGLNGHLFFAKWSRSNGRILMDAEFWNKLIAQN